MGSYLVDDSGRRLVLIMDSEAGVCCDCQRRVRPPFDDDGGLVWKVQLERFGLNDGATPLLERREGA